MTKIKIDIESDKDVVQANLIMKYADGEKLNKEIIETKIPDSSPKLPSSSPKKKGIDSSFTQSY